MKFYIALLTMLAVISPVVADDNIVIVFDTSGSMGETMRAARKTKMEVAKEAMISVLSQVPSTTKVGILTFNGWIYDLSAVDRTNMEKAINSCNPGGGTPLYHYTKQGADRLLQERTKQGNVGYYKLIVVTDGEANREDAVLNRKATFRDGSEKPGILEDIISRGIMVDAIGLEMNQDHALKNQINGQYMRGDDPGSIQQSIKKAVAEVGFKDDKATSDETFKEISELPEAFVRASLQGLTEFRNYPIGDKPPIRMVKDGVIIEVPSSASDSGIGFGMAVLIGMGIVLLVVIGIAVLTCRR